MGGFAVVVGLDIEGKLARNIARFDRVVVGIHERIAGIAEAMLAGIFEQEEFNGFAEGLYVWVHGIDNGTGVAIEEGFYGVDKGGVVFDVAWLLQGRGFGLLGLAVEGRGDAVDVGGAV